ncbi:MAG: hypothetical protein AB2765_17635 [Candidatus Thiodiazotropha endolucinida]
MKGIQTNTDLGKALDAMKDQLLIVLFNRLGGEVDIPISEVDGTGEYIVNMEVTKKQSFKFTVKRKQ